MNQLEALHSLQEKYNVVDIIDLATWSNEYDKSKLWLQQRLQQIRKDCYQPNERIVVIHTKDFETPQGLGLVIKNLQVLVNEVDISNNFVVVLSTGDIDQLKEILANISTDKESIEFVKIDGNFSLEYLEKHPQSRIEHYQYGSINPLKIKLEELDDREKFLLTESKVFCMYPWVHLHAWPTGEAFPCCMSEAQGQLGNFKTETMADIWNNDKMKNLRLNMLNDRPSNACGRCYEQEQSNFFSGRQSANKHHGHHVKHIKQTSSDGVFEQFRMTYWDIRFSNLCNLRCRSCGHIFSSQWYQDQVKIQGKQWALENKPLNYAGRFETDMLDQLLEHIDYVEQIYFAGGEPLMMEEHYHILEELERRKRFDVKLVYNTNFTQVKLKDRFVFDYWKKFSSVSVGASLDASYDRAEYIRKGTQWSLVEKNRQDMIEICPNVDFYISPTLSIMNAWHLPDFHREWVDKGLIQAQDLNINILQNPDVYRIDIANAEFKDMLVKKYIDHIAWLRPQDNLNRATAGFESAIKFLTSTDNSHLINEFWEKTVLLDNLRNERILDILPELALLKV